MAPAAAGRATVSKSSDTGRAGNGKIDALPDIVLLHGGAEGSSWSGCRARSADQSENRGRWAMTENPSEAEILCSADEIFDLIIDFRGQDRWLTESSAYHGTGEISSNPVSLGTTYREPGPFGVRIGRVTEVERPTKI